MLTKDGFIIRGFNCIHLTSHDIGGRACGGVSVLVRDGIPSSECTINTALQAKKRKQSPYIPLRLLLFVHYIYLLVRILIMLC